MLLAYNRAAAAGKPLLVCFIKTTVKMRMENALENRDTVGVADAVLLDDPDNTEEFTENLRKRFRGDIIYVSWKYLLGFAWPLETISTLKGQNATFFWILLHASLQRIWNILGG